MVYSPGRRVAQELTRREPQNGGRWAGIRRDQPFTRVANLLLKENGRGGRGVNVTQHTVAAVTVPPVTNTFTAGEMQVG